MNKLKVGDRVALYTTTPELPKNVKGLIVNVIDDVVTITVDGRVNQVWNAHYKQCRKLKPKAKPVEFYVNLYQSGPGVVYDSQDKAATFKGPGCVTIKVREVKE